MESMQIEFDPAKDVLNIRNHGLSLAMAAGLEWDLLVTHVDDSRHDYFEQRMVGLHPLATRCTAWCLLSAGQT